MQLLRNSTWAASIQCSELTEGDYRILQVCPSLDLLVLYKLQKPPHLNRPVGMSFTAFELGVEHGHISPISYSVPPVKQMSEDVIPEDWKKRRDDKYALISKLVEDDQFLPKLLESGRSHLIPDYARDAELSPVTVQRVLNEYWRYGQTRNALIPEYPNCGAYRKEKENHVGKRGRPKKQSIFDFKPRGSYLVTQKDKRQIRAATKKFFIKRKIKNLSKVYRKYLHKYHYHELKLAKAERRAPNVPTVEQFRYWHRQLYDQVADERERKGELNWDMDNRALLGSVSEHVGGPGACYQIDATVADVYVVSKYNRSRVLGRPVIYVIADADSRMVAGFFVDIVAASWDAAKQALLNAFLPKKEFCARYGVLIREEDWPCHHLPRALLCDNGEMKKAKPALHLPPMGIKLEFAAVGRADWKSVVERRFGIANDDSLHDLSGTTKGKPKGRMDPDPRKFALHTIDEVISILIKDFLAFNNTRYLDDLVTPQLIAEDLEPTPLNYWNLNVERHQHSLSVTDITQARIELMPAITPSVTGKGIRLGNRYYTCPLAEQENWFSHARATGEYSIEGRADDWNSSLIYVRKDSRSSLQECTLLPRERLYADLHRADVTWIDEWKREKRETGGDLLGRVRHEGEVEKLREDALEQRKSTIGSFADTPNNVADLEKARQAERQRIRAENADHPTDSQKGAGSLKDKLLAARIARIEELLDDDDP